ncbi:DUF397 domain-containing protein [Streptomyces sp. CHD11]|uniref:DUF397 domain-containing protein n=1 Tax=Streptomyces sp. CHD11 TaxID=2741325 RepID=UPI001BFC7576|nr:DUF397 domain-containing protein [Streptomyces sp. CHD11]MBT3154391.1 DUF397 domain-containing protein [Streptomyces sp. CHD11]
MSAEDAGLTWHKNSYSGNEGGACVEVAVGTAAIHVRDSKDVDRPHLSVRADGWAAFVAFAAAD